MHIKYLQPIFEIERHYDDIIRNIDRPKYGHLLLETWEIDSQDETVRKEIIEEKEALRYLLACQGMIARGDKNAKKPDIAVMNRCLERHLRFLETIHDCHAYNVNKHRLSNVSKQYKACRHYLFKFSLPAWYEKMPEEVLTFDNKYPNFR